MTVTDDVQRFANGDEADEFSSEADGLIHFCTANAVKSTRTDEAPNTSYVALVDDRSCAGGVTRSRPLTSDGLYEWLARPRFRHRKHVLSDNVDTSTPSSSQRQALKPGLLLKRSSEKNRFHASSAPPVQLSAVVPNSGKTEDESQELDADRRVIFVTNLDSSTATALIRTVSSNHAPALRDALCKHLAAESFMGVSISSRGLPMFKISFHLPFFALRSSRTPRMDHRSYVGSAPLRDVKDVSFLDWHDEGAPALRHLYEAHVTCVIAGFHDWCWTATCFVDTYYDDYVDRECVDDYHEHAENPQGMASDAPTLGDLEADLPIWNPREYFLLVVCSRLKRVKYEWQSTIKQVRESFRRYEQSNHYSLPQQIVHHHLGEHRLGKRTPQQDFNLTMRFLSLFTQLDECLSREIDAYEVFRSNYIAEFRQSARGYAPLAAIETIFEELKSLKKKIGYMEARGDRIKSTLELRLNHEVFENSKGQSRVVRYVTPMALTTSIFSMQKMAIPLVQPNFTWFLAILSIFSFMIFGVHTLSIALGRLSITSKMIGKVSCMKLNVGQVLRRKKNLTADDVENAPQSPTIDTSDGMRHNEVSTSGDDHRHRSHEFRSACNSGRSISPNSCSATNHQAHDIAPSGSRLSRREYAPP